MEKSFIEKMFEAMAKFQSDSLIIVKAALVLFTLFWRNNDRPSTLLPFKYLIESLFMGFTLDLPVMQHRHRLIRSIVSYMRQHKGDLSLQRTSAAMLSDFAHSDNTLKRLIVELGGKELVQDALRASPGDESDPEWNALAAFISIDD